MKNTVDASRRKAGRPVVTDKDPKKEKVKAWYRAYYQRNKKHIKSIQDRWRKKQRKNGLCILCPNIIWRPGARLCQRHRKVMSQANKDSHSRQRLRCFDAYNGRFCNCCGETHVEFLSMDHIEGGGKKHYAEIGSNIYKWLEQHKYPKGFRVLCMNCNFSRGHYSYCPHEKEVKTTRL